MTVTAIPRPLRSSALIEAAPELARRIGGILAALAGLVARAFLRRPSVVGLIVPLWKRLSRVAGRVERAIARSPMKRAPRAKGARAARPDRLRLPAGRGWLVRELGHEAANYGTQLAHLLADPEMQAALALPGVARILRPICWWLGAELVVPAVPGEKPRPVARPWPRPAKVEKVTRSAGPSAGGSGFDWAAAMRGCENRG